MRDIIPILPHFQAVLNFTTVCLLSLAYISIRRRDKATHRKYMIRAILVSSVFMVSYLFYHSQVGYAKFLGEGLIRPIYFTILASHIILAALIAPLVLITVFYAWRAHFTRHRSWARWTFPIWVYVSVSGIVVYLLAFHIYPSEIG